MAIYTSNYLKNITRRNRKKARFSSHEETSSLKEFPIRRNVFNASIFEKLAIETSFDIFLSHSFLDRDEVEGLYIELTNQGYSVYVDWIIDPHLDRTNVTKTSARLIQKRLQVSKSLLLAISINATVSKWMPWELGYVDGNTNKCAILPVSKIANAPDSYLGSEYLSIYPFIKKVATDDQGEELFVIEESQKYINFDAWIKLGEKPKKQQTPIF